MNTIQGSPKRRGQRSREQAQRNPTSPTTGEDAEFKKSDATRRRILDAAALVMSREGFAGTKLSDIAGEAKVKIATLYYYYPSREDLVEAVLVSGSRHVREHTQEAVSRLAVSVTPLERLCVAVEAHLRYILEISHYTEAAVRNSGQVPERIREATRAEQSKYGRLWQELIDAAVAGTPSTTAQRKALRMLILGGLNWTVEWWSAKQMPIDDLVEAALALTRAAVNKARR
ncbi:TetR/AcrR family transcriptional regulator [Bradyrhizobium liaoningense]